MLNLYVDPASEPGRKASAPLEGMDRMGEIVKIRYAKRETGWAEDLGGGKYRIDNIPLTDRLNIDDLVRCRLNGDGELVVSRRLKRRYPEKTAVRFERAEQYRLLRQKVLAAGAKIEGMIGPQGGKPGLAVVAHGYNFDPVAAAREVGIESPEAFDA
jgi:hypothetical protein